MGQGRRIALCYLLALQSQETLQRERGEFYTPGGDGRRTQEEAPSAIYSFFLTEIHVNSRKTYRFRGMLCRPPEHSLVLEGPRIERSCPGNRTRSSSRSRCKALRCALRKITSSAMAVARLLSVTHPGLRAPCYWAYDGLLTQRHNVIEITYVCVCTYIYIYTLHILKFSKTHIKTILNKLNPSWLFSILGH
ncbi:hypothetical protein HJG60_009390 [Phyllostomus discolor]|uniref:Uncharacterized protein n=1 Tax=Phyllostomus discolor TaxID=89673 RepID=A0A834D8U7_9CHIR|nr:hypothetical protein HJG60_009390 [Phyllostomus discolor]